MLYGAHAGMKRTNNSEEQAVGVKRRRVDDQDTSQTSGTTRSSWRNAWNLKNYFGTVFKTVLGVLRPSRDEVVENPAIEYNGMEEEPTNEMHSMFGVQRGGGGGGGSRGQQEEDQTKPEATAGVGDRQEGSRKPDFRRRDKQERREDASSIPTTRAREVEIGAAHKITFSRSHALRHQPRVGSSYLQQTQQKRDHVTYNELLRSSGSVLPFSHASSTSCTATTDPSPSHKVAPSLLASSLSSRSRSIQPVLYSTPVYDHHTADQAFTNHTLPYSTTRRLHSTTATSAWAHRHSLTIDSSSSATPGGTSSSSHCDELSSQPKTPSLIHHSDVPVTSQTNDWHQLTSPLSLPSPLSHHMESTSTNSTKWLKTIEHSSTLADYETRLEALKKYQEMNRTKRMEAEDSRYSKCLDRIKSLNLQDKKKSELKQNRSDLKLKLTDSQAEMVKRAWGRGYIDEVLAEGFIMKITRRDLSTLRGLDWLNDEVINFYLKLVVDQVNSAGTCKVHLFNSFFYPKLLSNGYSGVRRWTKKVDIFAHDVLLLPVHLGMHWCLAAVDFRSKHISYYDSLKGSNRQCLSMLRDYLVSEAKDKKQMDYDVSDWTLSTPKDIPEQRNGSDCGVFTCMYARHIAKDQPFVFSQEDMPQIRMLMVAEIISKSLL